MNIKNIARLIRSKYLNMNSPKKIIRYFYRRGSNVFDPRLYRITTSDGEKHLCDQSHYWPSIENDYKIGKYTARANLNIESIVSSRYSNIPVDLMSEFPNDCKYNRSFIYAQDNCLWAAHVMHSGRDMTLCKLVTYDNRSKLYRLYTYDYDMHTFIESSQLDNGKWTITPVHIGKIMALFPMDIRSYIISDPELTIHYNDYIRDIHGIALEDDVNYDTLSIDFTEERNDPFDRITQYEDKYIIEEHYYEHN